MQNKEIVSIFASDSATTSVFIHFSHQYISASAQGHSQLLLMCMCDAILSFIISYSTVACASNEKRKKNSEAEQKKTNAKCNAETTDLYHGSSTSLRRFP